MLSVDVRCKEQSVIPNKERAWKIVAVINLRSYWQMWQPENLRFVGVAAWPGLACFRSSGSKQKNCNSPGLKTWKFLMTGVQHPGRVWRLQRAAAPLREMSQCKHQDSQEETAPTSTVNWTVFYWLNWRLMALKNLLMLFINWTRKNTILWSGCHVMFLF